MKTNEFNFRTTPVAEDIKSIRDIVESTGFFRADEIDIAVELIEDRLDRGKSSGYEFLFACQNGKPVAYCCYGLIPCTIKSYDLYWIAVHNSYRGTGIGSYLLKLTEKEIASAGGYGVYVETSSRDQYLSTRKFYEKNNYKLKACFEDFYDDDDDKIVYFKCLSDRQHTWREG
jgi:ribosomal protein S18 acetylase RimI-like enzyme